MNRDMLFKKVKELGFPLLETEKQTDVNNTLAEVIKSEDHRLWEGFPVMLANCLEKNLFDYEKVSEHLKKTQEKQAFRKLVMMSLAVYTYLELEFAFADKLYRSKHYDHKFFNEFLNRFKEKRDLPDINGSLSTERVITIFKNYFKRADLDLREAIDMQDEFELEYAMSQILSKKQKEIFLKKLKGEKLTKTEREYYSRSIKKKVLALANPDLHKLAFRLARE
jgi:hypothetical protein